ncbi:MAG: hypothetical protein AB8H47_07195 [Bacteroidia bacterium]
MANNIITDLRHNMSDGKIPFEARMLGLAMLLINIPAAVFGLLFFWVILPLPGLVLYGFVIAMSFGKLSVDKAKLTTILTMIYHLVLLIILFGIGEEPGGSLIYNWLFIMPLSTIGFGEILLRVLKESENEAHESA